MTEGGGDSRVGASERLAGCQNLPQHAAAVEALTDLASEAIEVAAHLLSDLAALLTSYQEDTAGKPESEGRAFIIDHSQTSITAALRFLYGDERR